MTRSREPRAGLDARAGLGDHLVVRDGGEFDLVSVGRIPEIDEVRGGVGAAGANPHGHRVGERGLRTAAEPKRRAAKAAQDVRLFISFLPDIETYVLFLGKASLRSQ